MATEVHVPTLGESVSEASIMRWFKQPGEAVAVDEPLVELETDKVTVEVPSPVTGTLTDIAAAEGAEVEVGALLCTIAEGAAAAAPKAETPKAEPPKAEAPKPAPAAAPAAEPVAAPASNETLSPAVAKMVAENNLDASKIPATGPKGNLTKEDVQNFLSAGVKPAPAAAKRNTSRLERSAMRPQNPELTVEAMPAATSSAPRLPMPPSLCSRASAA